MSKTGEVETYIRKHGVALTHWGKRIIQAERNLNFSNADLDDASRWSKCAVGKCTTEIEREPWHEAVDVHLNGLGKEFDNAVHFGDIMRAAETLVKIERRAQRIGGSND